MDSTIKLGDVEVDVEELLSDVLAHKGPASPLEERIATHRSHLEDRKGGEASVYSFEDCNFIITKKSDEKKLIVSPPLHKKNHNVPLKRIVYILMTKEPEYSIDFRGVSPQVWHWNFPVIMHKDMRDTIKLYQKPLSVTEYEGKLKKFKNSGFVFTELDVSNASDIEELSKIWTNNKFRAAKNSLVSTLDTFESDLEETHDPDGLLYELSAFHTEINQVYGKVPTLQDIKEDMSKPLVKYHGVFRDDQLLAFTNTAGNRHFQIFEKRASVRMNGKSPQEYLDLCLARELVSQGVKLFDRGYAPLRKGLPGVIEYKSKFGPIWAELEYTLYSASIQDVPERNCVMSLLNAGDLRNKEDE